MAIPANYTMTPSGLYQNSLDNSIGYSIDSAGAPVFLGGSLISVDATGYSQGLGGLYYGPSGDGPYLKNSSGEIYSLGI
jgi:hypothetical protein